MPAFPLDIVECEALPAGDVRIRVRWGADWPQARAGPRYTTDATVSRESARVLRDALTRILEGEPSA